MNYINNKKIGTAFEIEMCETLRKAGYWVHFLTPNSRGAQPFDILAIKDGVPIAMDCKTSVSRYFPITRLEDNQIMAFGKWLECGNGMPYIVVKYQERIITIPYEELREQKRIDLDERIKQMDAEREGDS